MKDKRLQIPLKGTFASRQVTEADIADDMEVYIAADIEADIERALGPALIKKLESIPARTSTPGVLRLSSNDGARGQQLASRAGTH